MAGDLGPAPSSTSPGSMVAVCPGESGCHIFVSERSSCGDFGCVHGAARLFTSVLLRHVYLIFTFLYLLCMFPLAESFYSFSSSSITFLFVLSCFLPLFGLHYFSYLDIFTR